MNLNVTENSIDEASDENDDNEDIPQGSGYQANEGTDEAV